MPTSLHVRPARVDDLERILAIHTAAYPDERTVIERRRNFEANPLGGLEDLFVVEREGTVVGQAFLFALEAWFGGRAVRVGAVASVAVAPEARGQGVATGLLAGLHRTSDVRGDAITMLYAFRYRFYLRAGYGTSCSRKRLAIDPASIPRGWSDAARARVRAAGRGERPAIREAYERVARTKTGWLTRPPALWDRHLARERRQFLVAPGPGGTIAGYVAFELTQEEAHAETSLLVDELVADDSATERALYGALGALRDQVDVIEIELEEGHPLEVALLDPDGRRRGDETVEHPLGTVVGGPMVRIEDVARAVEARGYASDGTFDLVVATGEPREAGVEEMAIRVRVEQGRAVVGSAQAAVSALRTTRSGLASMLYGGLRVRDAVRLGLADADPRTAAKADEVLALPPPAPVDRF
ncbi:MAG: GNAT family N-acetyltransferase [Deltaproteobacteria bacterium]|nr:GNAT family N-acetyltransferase [Deltaproteobacteria bacterium]